MHRIVDGVDLAGAVPLKPEFRLKTIANIDRKVNVGNG
jgi:hypothetical protein